MDEPEGRFTEEEDGPGDEGDAAVAPDRERAPLAELTGEERRLVDRLARRFWGRWRRWLPGAAREDLEIEAALAALAVRERAAGLPRAAAMAYTARAIAQRLARWVAGEIRQRGGAAAIADLGLDPNQARELAGQRVADWAALAGETLLEVVEDEQRAAALRALSPLDRRILDLKLIERLTYARIAARLNERPDLLPRGRMLTARAVESRFRRAKQKLRALLEDEVAE